MESTITDNDPNHLFNDFKFVADLNIDKFMDSSYVNANDNNINDNNINTNNELNNKNSSNIEFDSNFLVNDTIQDSNSNTNIHLNTNTNTNTETNIDDLNTSVDNYSGSDVSPSNNNNKNILQDIDTIETIDKDLVNVNVNVMSNGNFDGFFNDYMMNDILSPKNSNNVTLNQNSFNDNDNFDQNDNDNDNVSDDVNDPLNAHNSNENKFTGNEVDDTDFGLHDLRRPSMVVTNNDGINSGYSNFRGSISNHFDPWNNQNAVMNNNIRQNYNNASLYKEQSPLQSQPDSELQGTFQDNQNNQNITHFDEDDDNAGAPDDMNNLDANFLGNNNDNLGNLDNKDNSDNTNTFMDDNAKNISSFFKNYNMIFSDSITEENKVKDNLVNNEMAMGNSSSSSFSNVPSTNNSTTFKQQFQHPLPQRRQSIRRQSLKITEEPLALANMNSERRYSVRKTPSHRGSVPFLDSELLSKLTNKSVMTTTQNSSSNNLNSANSNVSSLNKPVRSLINDLNYMPARNSPLATRINNDIENVDANVINSTNRKENDSSTDNNDNNDINNTLNDTVRTNDTNTDLNVNFSRPRARSVFTMPTDNIIHNISRDCFTPNPTTQGINRNIAKNNSRPNTPLNQQNLNLTSTASSSSALIDNTSNNNESYNTSNNNNNNVSINQTSIYKPSPGPLQSSQLQTFSRPVSQMSYQSIDRFPFEKENSNNNNNNRNVYNNTNLMSPLFNKNNINNNITILHKNIATPVMNHTPPINMDTNSTDSISQQQQIVNHQTQIYNTNTNNNNNIDINNNNNNSNNASLNPNITPNIPNNIPETFSPNFVSRMGIPTSMSPNMMAAATMTQNIIPGMSPNISRSMSPGILQTMSPGMIPNMSPGMIPPGMIPGMIPTGMVAGMPQNMYPMNVNGINIIAAQQQYINTMESEDRDKPFKCATCLKNFKRAEHLKRHIRSVHTQERPYPCLICSKKFSRSDNLAQHMKTHKKHGDY